MEIANLQAVIGVETGRFRAGMAQVDAIMGRTAGRLRDMDAQTSRTGALLAKVGKGAAIGIGAGLAASVVAALSFEKSMAQVRAVTDVTDKQFQQMKASALALSSSVQGYGYSANDVAAAQTELGKAGLRVAQITGGGLTAALTLARAGNLQLGESAAYVANAMQQFGLRGADAQKVADAMATAANTTTADVGDFGAALVQTGAAARSAGYSYNQTMTALTALAASGVKGSDAGTSLKTSLLQLINPTNKQEEAAKNAGIAFRDQQGRMKDLASIAAMLRERTDGMTKANRTALFATLAGTDGVRTLLSLYNAGPAQIAKYSASLMKQGSAAKMAADMNDTTAARLERLKNQVLNLGIEVGTTLLPALSGIAEALSGAFATVAPFIKSIVTGIVAVGNAIKNNEFAVAALKAVFAALVAVKVAQWATAAAMAIGRLAVVSGVATAVTGLSQAASVLVGGLGRVNAASVGLAPGLTAAQAGMSRFAAAGTLAGSSFARLGSTMLTAVGGWPGVVIGTTAALATVIGSDLVASFTSGMSAADRYAQSQRNAAAATDALKNSTANLIGGFASVAQAESAETAARTRVAAATRAAAQARAQYGAGSAQAKAAAKNERDANIALASSISATDQARQQSKGAAQTQIKALVDTGNSVRALAADYTTKFAGMRPIIGANAEATRAWGQKAALAGVQFMRTNKTVQEQQRTAARMVPALKALGPQYASAAKAAEQLANAKTPAGYDKALGNLARALGGTSKQADAAAGRVNAALRRMGVVQISTGNVDGQIKAAGQRWLASAEAAAAQVNAALRKIGLKTSPDVATTIAENLDNVAKTADGRLVSMKGAVLGRVTGINSDLRKAMDVSSLIGSYESPPGLRNLYTDLKALGAQQVAVSVRNGKKFVMVDGMQEAIRITRALTLATAQLEREQAKEKPDKTKTRRLQGRITKLKNRGMDVQSQLAEALKGSQGLAPAITAALDATRSQLNKAIDQKFGDVAVVINGRATIQAGLFTQLQRGLDTGLKAIDTALKGGLVGNMDQIAVQFRDRLTALSADAKRVSALSDPKNLTDEERSLRDYQDQQSAADKALAMSEAQAKLREAQMWGDAESIREAQKQIADLEKQQHLENLQKAAEESRAKRDEEAARERDTLEANAQQLRDDMNAQAEADRLLLQQQQAQEQADVDAHISALQTKMEQLPGILFSSRQKQQQELAKIVAMFSKMGDKAGAYFKDNLAAEFGKVDNVIIKVLAKRVRDLLKLNSPAKKGPLSTIDTWWTAMPETLASGIDFSSLDDVAAAVTRPKFSSSDGAGAGTTVINLTVTDQTFAGMSRDQADRVASQIQSAINRRVGIAI